MIELSLNAILQIAVQGFMVVIVIGGAYSLWKTTQAFGGLIGDGLKWIGFGMLAFSIEAIDRVLGTLSVISSISADNAELIHRALLLVGLLLASIGFSKLTKITGGTTSSDQDTK